MNKDLSMLDVVCPECGAAFDIPNDSMTGEVFTCPECGVELELVNLDPPTLEVAPDVEEDWGE
jgi:alpha-aminoadipate carrier protein LysW